MKMEKTPRYTQRERNMVLGYAAQYKDVIENKRTDAESNRKKDEVWRQIAKEFNGKVYHQRSAKQLRQLYKNMKLLLKKDLCGEGKGNRSFMDLLNTLSQQESVAQYISEQMSPSGYSSSRQQRYDDDYDDSTKLPSVGFDGMDTDVIVIKSEDLSDNDQSRQPPSENMDDDDDDDCLSTKDIPEVCLEEEDDEIFATDLRQPPVSTTTASLTPSQRQQLQLLTAQQQQGQQQQTQQQQRSTPPQAEITIHNVGGIRVGSIGSLANLKALQQNGGGNNSALSITNTNNASHNNNNNNNNSSQNNNGSNSVSSGLRQLTPAEQAQQQLLLNGLGLSAVHSTASTPPPPPTLPLPTLQRVSALANGGGASSHANALLLNAFGHTKGGASVNLGNNIGGSVGIGLSSSRSGHSNTNSNQQQHSDYLMSLAIEERKRKIDLLNAQIDYWKTLTKKLDANSGHNPTPACMCHFPGKVNGLQTQTNTS